MRSAYVRFGAREHRVERGERRRPTAGGRPGARRCRGGRRSTRARSGTSATSSRSVAIVAGEIAAAVVDRGDVEQRDRRELRVGELGDELAVERDRVVGVAGLGGVVGLLEQIGGRDRASARARRRRRRRARVIRMMSRSTTRGSLAASRALRIAAAARVGFARGEIVARASAVDGDGGVGASAARPPHASEHERRARAKRMPSYDV